MKKCEPVGQITLQQAKILILDDQQLNVDIIREYLEEEGFFNVHSEIYPEKVMTTFATVDQESDFDLVILDLMMPGFNGFDVMKMLQYVQNAVPILVVTALDQKSVHLKALESGATDFLGKPFSKRELLVRVNNILLAYLAQKRLAFHNALLSKVVRKRTKELELSHLEIIRRLGTVSEFRDNETGLHMTRMSHYARLIALKAGFSESEAELLLKTAPMHDIGKTAIPDRVLLKPGKLSSEEWQLMETHAKVGADILSGHDSELMKFASEIAWTHHEKWNGEGYPRGLSGKAIPTFGRIVAIADVFDALTSSRPYKKAWATEEAVAFIRDQRGEHFEPKLVDAFLSAFSSILKIKEEHKEPVTETSKLIEGV